MKVINQTAVERSKNRIPYPIRHITTLAVNDCRITGLIPLRQGDKAFVDYSQFSRLSPLVAPTFGDFKIKTHAFWVPLRLIWKHYGEYLSETSDSSFNNIKAPLNFSIDDVLRAFINEGKYTIYQGESDNFDDYENCDLQTVQYNDGFVVAGYNFTDLGRLVWNNLQALGYGLPTFVPFTYGMSADEITQLNTLFPGSSVVARGENHSLYPLLAFARVLYDWIFPSQYITQQSFGYLFNDALYGRFGSVNSDQRKQVLQNIFDLIITPYDRNFYTSLWFSPNQVAPNSKSYVAPSFVQSGNNNNNDFNYVQSVEPLESGGRTEFPNDTIVSKSRSDVSLNGLSASSLRWLERISDFVLRNNIGGTRVRDYLKSHFGFAPSQMDDVSSWIRTFTDNVQISDVTNMSTAVQSDGSDSVLGEQGGKGVSSGSNSIRFEASEKGFLIFLTQVVPSIGYYQGEKIHARAIRSRFDLYHPDFDGVGMVGVPRSAIFSQHNSVDDVEKVPFDSLDDVFGFAPNYAEKKVGYDLLTGDFLFKTRNRGLDSYHTFRDVLYGRNNLALDRQFLSADNQTQRIFAFVGEEKESGLYAQYDKIFTFIKYDTTITTDMKSLSESMPFFEDEGKRVASNYEGEQL